MEPPLYFCPSLHVAHPVHVALVDALVQLCGLRVQGLPGEVRKQQGEIERGQVRLHVTLEKAASKECCAPCANLTEEANG